MKRADMTSEQLEAVRARDRRYHTKYRGTDEGREAHNASSRAYHHKNRERLLEQMRTYQRDNREADLQRGRKYRQTENGKAAGRIRVAKRRALLRTDEAEHVDPLIVLELDDGVCGICGGDVNPFDYHVDHVIPLARGGAHTIANTQPAHPSCNVQKGASL